MDPIYLKTYFIYTNNQNEIMQIKETKIETEYQPPNYIIPKMGLIQKIHSMKKDELGVYILKHISCHHIIVNDNNVQDYIERSESYNFLKEISYFSDLVLEETNEIFNKLSSLYVIFQQKPHINHASTKKIKINLQKTNKRKSLKQKY